MIRLALVCPACRKAGHARREFDRPDWRCPEHPGIKPEVQMNNTYFGKPTPQFGINSE